MLGKLSDFTKEFIVKIPKYQRGYAWRQGNWEDMLQDILQQPLTKNHYCGPVVFTRLEGHDVVISGPVSKKIGLVHLEDGQQRITTLIMAAWNIINVINSDTTKYERLVDFSRDLHKDVVYYSERVGSSLKDYRHPRLTSGNHEYNEFLIKFFTGQNPSGFSAATRRLLSVSEAQRNYFSKLSIDDLEVNSTRLLEGLMFVFVNLGEQNIDPQVAFHTINSRGVPLREFDKVKNGLMSIVSQIGAQNRFHEVESEWYQTILLLDNHELQLDEDSFLSMSFGIRMDRRSSPSRSNLSEEILGSVQAVGSGASKLNYVEDILDSWRCLRDPFVYIYTRGKHQYYKASPSVASQVHNDFVDSLRRLESMKLEGIVQPLLMVAHQKMLDSQIPKKAELAILLEKFVFRVFALARNRIDHLRSELHALCCEFYHDRKSVDDVIKNVVFWTIQYCPLGRALEDLFDSDRLRYDRWESNRLGYFLLEYEHNLVRGLSSSGHPIIWKKEQHSIEHICPQQQSGSYSNHLRYNDLHLDWRKAFANANNWRNNLHRIGNLVITENNAPLGNKPWEQKKLKFREFSKAERELETFVKSPLGWNEEAILKRECALASFVVKRWNIGLDTEKLVRLPLSLQTFCGCSSINSVHDVNFRESEIEDHFSSIMESSVED